MTLGSLSGGGDHRRGTAPRRCPPPPRASLPAPLGKAQRANLDGLPGPKHHGGACGAWQVREQNTYGLLRSGVAFVAHRGAICGSDGPGQRSSSLCA